jgi:hypothetical protein
MWGLHEYTVIYASATGISVIIKVVMCKFGINEVSLYFKRVKEQLMVPPHSAQPVCADCIATGTGYAVLLKT